MKRFSSIFSTFQAFALVTDLTPSAFASISCASEDQRNQVEEARVLPPENGDKQARYEQSGEMVEVQNYPTSDYAFRIWFCDAESGERCFVYFGEANDVIVIFEGCCTPKKSELIVLECQNTSANRIKIFKRQSILLSTDSESTLGEHCALKRVGGQY
ncbi:MAG: hypothetical protein HUJ51_05500 [Eggerthellaceae bacterium]|nr:hypothetical protein [Eggerthellaceae bacterium]